MKWLSWAYWWHATDNDVTTLCGQEIPAMPADVESEPPLMARLCPKCERRFW